MEETANAQANGNAKANTNANADLHSFSCAAAKRPVKPCEFCGACGMTEVMPGQNNDF
jgi:hypothetical protein